MNLIQRLKDGEIGVIDKVIKEYIELPKLVSWPFRSSNHWMAEDILAEANLALITGVYRVYDLGEKYEGIEIGGFLTMHIRKKVRRYINRNHTIRIPHNRYAEMIKTCAPDEYVLTKVHLNDWDPAAVAPEEAPDLQEVCTRHGLNQQESVIIRMLDEGFQKQEIATSIGVSNGIITRRLKRIRQRMMECTVVTKHGRVMAYA